MNIRFEHAKINKFKTIQGSLPLYNFIFMLYIFKCKQQKMLAC